MRNFVIWARRRKSLGRRFLRRHGLRLAVFVLLACVLLGVLFSCVLGTNVAVYQSKQIETRLRLLLLDAEVYCPDFVGSPIYRSYMEELDNLLEEKTDELRSALSFDSSMDVTELPHSLSGLDGFVDELEAELGKRGCLRSGR